MFHESITDSGITIEPDNLTHDILLLDMSGFPITYVEVERVTYKSGTESFSQEPMELQFVIDTAVVGNSFIGFDSAEELAKYHLLGNYLNNSLPARTFLLQNSFKMLSEITSGEIHLDGRMQKLSESDRRKWLGAIQIDIISKIMMQMEDLIVLMDSMLSVDGDYYNLLDGGEYGDLGERINKFFERVKNLRQNDIMKNILHYVEPESVTSDLYERSIVSRLSESNVARLREFIDKVRVFRNTHRQIFRRYKHACFPFDPGLDYRSDISFTRTEFDFYSMVYTGKDPLSDVIPLPYSDQVINSYKILISSLRVLLEDLVSAKIECIERKVDGIVPTLDYSKPNVLSKEEVKRLLAIGRRFNKEHPIHMKNYLHEIKMTYLKQEQLQWYIELDKLMLVEKKDNSGAT
ncbi:MAG: hypothetical protein ACREAS_11230 [Nitrososphaera sp.]